MAECKDTQADQVQGETSEMCEQCKVDDIMQPAAGWCETCDEFLCNDCYRAHCRQKTMRNHQLTSIVDMKNMKHRKRLSDNCDKHEGKPLEYFCEDHTKLGCSQCFVTKHRLCSKVVCIAYVKTKEMEEFTALEMLLSQFESRLKANAEHIEGNLSLAARQHDKAIADIKEAGNKLKAHIDGLVKQQILKERKRNEDNMRNMSSVEETNKVIAKKVKDGKEMIAVERNDNTRLFVTMKYLRLDTEVIDFELEECEKKISVREYEFELCSELAEVLEKVKHLETLKERQLLDLEKMTDEVVDVVEVRRFRGFSIYYPEGGYISDAISVSTDQDIRLLHVLVYACTWGDTKVSLTIREGDNCLIKCNGNYKTEEADQTVMAVNVVKEGGAHGITLQADHEYVIDVTGRGEWAYYYYGNNTRGEASFDEWKVKEKGVTLTFRFTARTNLKPDVFNPHAYGRVDPREVDHGSITGLRVTII